MRRLAVLLFLLVPVLAGCGSTPATTVLSAPSQANAAQAQSNVWAALPSIEAWFAERGTYVGATAAGLRAEYDSALPEVRVAWASASSYCLDSSVGEAAMSFARPRGSMTPGLCAPPSGAPATSVPRPSPMPLAAPSDVFELVTRDATAMEAFAADQGGGYYGATLTKLRRYDKHLAPVRIAHADSWFCLELRAGGVLVHYDNRQPEGRLGACPRS